MEIGTFGIGANSTESAIARMKMIGQKTPKSSNHSRNGSASISVEKPKAAEAPM